MMGHWTDEYDGEDVNVTFKNGHERRGVLRTRYDTYTMECNTVDGEVWEVAFSPFEIVTIEVLKEEASNAF